MTRLPLKIGTGLIIAAIGYFSYNALKPPFWETDHPLQATTGPVNLLDDLDTENLGDGWKERTFFRITPTKYAITQDDGDRTLRCTTQNSGSILARDTDIELRDLPLLTWQWKVTTPNNSGIDEDTHEGDDHPLRFYLRFTNGAGESKGTEIIWSNQKYTAGDYKIIGSFYHLVANRLDENIGAWHDQSVDLRELYSDIGGTGSARLDVLGFFCDSDNAGGTSDGSFKNIQLSADIAD